jgi:thymidylate synthase (FAD)
MDDTYNKGFIRSEDNLKDIKSLGSLGEIELIDYMGTDLTIVNSARVSYGKRKLALDDKDRKLIRYLIKNNHVSTLEHCYMTFRIKCPKPINVQWLRHQSWKFNEISGRYVEFENEFYIPDSFRQQHKSSKQASIEGDLSSKSQDWARDMYKDSIDKAYSTYLHLLDSGIAKEQARGVLPFAFMTEFYATCNLRSFIHWYIARSHEHAQWEIQQFAKALMEKVKVIYPEAVECFLEVEKEKKSDKETIDQLQAELEYIKVNGHS